MNSENLKVVLHACRKSGVTSMIWGGTGVGKSETVKQYADENKLQFVDLRIGTQEAGDLIGLPSQKDDKTVWLKPCWFPEEGTKGVLFLDELNLCK